MPLLLGLRLPTISSKRDGFTSHISTMAASRRYAGVHRDLRCLARHVFEPSGNNGVDIVWGWVDGNGGRIMDTSTLKPAQEIARANPVRFPNESAEYRRVRNAVG